MKTKDKYSKSLELLDKFIANTPARELQLLLKKHSNIQGPTFNEYLILFEESYTLINLADKAEEEPGLSLKECWDIGLIKASNYDNYYIPPQGDNKKTMKKDSGLNTESFFLLYLQHDRSQKSSLQI